MSPILASILLKVIDGVIFAIENAPEAATKWTAHLRSIRTMIAEGRDPTVAETAAADGEAKAQEDALQSAVDRNENG